MIRTIVIATLLATAAMAQPAPVRQFVVNLQPVRAGLTLQTLDENERKVAMEHAAYLKSLLDQGKLKLAGQALDPKGLWGILIVEAPDLQTATALANADPGVQGKLFRAEVAPFRTVFERPATTPAR